MIPKSLSATSLHVASLCMARWKAEYMDRIPGFSGVAANIGSAVHGGLERYVELVYIKKEREPSLDLLVSLYELSYIEVFKTADKDTNEYRDGLDMIERWFKRTDFSGVTVETVEVKETIDIPVVDPATGKKFTIPFNYIMDRVDQLGETEWRVVDYKSVRVPIQPDELHGKIQARAYGLAIQIKHKEAQKIRVVFDLLRHDPVGTVISRDDNVATWRYLKSEAQRIVNTDEEDVEPTLNMECGYCPIKATCPKMRGNIDAGGIHSLSTSELALLKMQVESQQKGQKYLLEEVEELLLKEAVERDSLEWEEDNGTVVEITMSRRRQVDASQVARIIGPDLFSQLGTITLGVLDNLMKDPSLSEEQKKELKKLIYFKTGDPKAKVKPRKALV